MYFKKGEHMKLTIQRTFALLALCLIAPALIADKKNHKNVHWEDVVDPKVYVVSNTNPCGPGSLQRAAEKAAKCKEEETIIKFCLKKSDPGYNKETGRWVITLEKTLEIPSNTTIDGFSQKCSSENTQDLENPDDSVIAVEIQPSTEVATATKASVKASAKAAAAINGFDTIAFPLTTRNAKVRGLIVRGSRYPLSGAAAADAAILRYPAAIRILGNANIVEGSYIGNDGENADNTIIALSIEGNNNVIGDALFDIANEAAIARPRPATRMIINGIGASLNLPAAATSAVTPVLDDVPAIRITGSVNRIVNAQLGIRKSGSGIFNRVSRTGLQLSALGVQNTADAALASDDLTVHTVAAAGQSNIAFSLPRFNSVKFANVSAGLNLKRSAAFGGGIGLLATGGSLAAASAEAAPQAILGKLSIKNSIFSGLNTGLILGLDTLPAAESAFVTPDLDTVEIENTFLGTDITGGFAIPNVNGALSQRIRSLTVTRTTVSGNTNLGWQHRVATFANAAEADLAIPGITIFRQNYVGIGTPTNAVTDADAVTFNRIPNNIGLSIVGAEPVLFDGNVNEFNIIGVTATKNAVLQRIGEVNILRNNIKANLLYTNRIPSIQ